MLTHPADYIFRRCLVQRYWREEAQKMGLGTEEVKWALVTVQRRRWVVATDRSSYEQLTKIIS